MIINSIPGSMLCRCASHFISPCSSPLSWQKAVIWIIQIASLVTLCLVQNRSIDMHVNGMLSHMFNFSSRLFYSLIQWNRLSAKHFITNTEKKLLSLGDIYKRMRNKIIAVIIAVI